MSNIVVSSNSEFYNTYRLYKEYLGYEEPYTYKKWLNLPIQFKAAALYVQFYNEITLAWYKVKTKWSIEEDGVSTINQYLIKNVEKISNDEKRFTPQYIYKVAYNCLYCICIDPSKNKDRYFNETSETFETSDDELSWFDFVGLEENSEDNSDKKAIRDFINSLEEDYQIYIGYVLGELTEAQLIKNLKKLNSKYKGLKSPELRAGLLKSFEEEYREKLKSIFEVKFSTDFANNKILQDAISLI